MCPSALLPTMTAGRSKASCGVMAKAVRLRAMSTSRLHQACRYPALADLLCPLTPIPGYKSLLPWQRSSSGLLVDFLERGLESRGRGRGHGCPGWTLQTFQIPGVCTHHPRLLAQPAEVLQRHSKPQRSGLPSARCVATP